MKSKIINLFSKIKVLNRYYSGIGTILMLHRVSPFEKDKLFPNENMKISPEFLEKIILELKDKKYEIISLDRLFQILQNNEKVEKQIQRLHRNQVRVSVDFSEQLDRKLLTFLKNSVDLGFSQDQNYIALT